MRGILISTTALAIILGAATVAAANDVPGINDDAVLDAPCNSADRYIFGRGPSAEPLACVAFDGAGQWVRSMPLVGVRAIGSPCVDESDGVAQSPDGLGLLCVPDSIAFNSCSEVAHGEDPADTVGWIKDAIELQRRWEAGQIRLAALETKCPTLAK